MTEPVKETAQKRRVGDGTPGPGRPKGVPNKATVQARQAFQDAFDEIGGVKKLAEWAKGEPGEFFKLFARLIPVDVKATSELTGEITVRWLGKS